MSRQNSAPGNRKLEKPASPLQSLSQYTSQQLAQALMIKEGILMPTSNGKKERTTIKSRSASPADRSNKSNRSRKGIDLEDSCMVIQGKSNAQKQRNEGYCVDEQSASMLQDDFENMSKGGSVIGKYLRGHRCIDLQNNSVLSNAYKKSASPFTRKKVKKAARYK
jgi:hypothetical protein